MIISEIYKAHKRRVEALDRQIKDLNDQLAIANDKFQQNREAQTEIDDLLRKWKERLETQGRQSKKSPERIKDENRIKELRSLHPHNEFRSLSSEIKKLENKLEQAEKNYSFYSLENLEFEEESEGEIRKQERKIPDVQDAYFDIHSLPTLQWIPWPKIKLPSFSSDKVGIGKGEERLATLLGGEVQGGSVSFDIILSDGSIWEVKELSVPSSEIRLGAAHMAVYDQTRNKLNEIFNNIKDFSNSIDESTIENIDDPHVIKIINYTKSFLNVYYDKVIKKGELAGKGVDYLVKVIKLLSTIKSKYEDQERSIDLTFNKKINYQITKNEYVKIANVLKDTDPDILESIENLTKAISFLSNPAFDNPEQFFEELENSLDIKEFFKEADGIIIVNQMKGFNIVPKEMISDVIEWSNLSQNQPKLRFMRF